MALELDSSHPQVNGAASPSWEEAEALYEELLRLRDVVIAGTHPTLKLPASAVEQLKASLSAPLANGTSASHLNGVVDSSPAVSANPQQSAPLAQWTGLPGLSSATSLSNGGSKPFGAKAPTAGGLDPIFLEKSDSLVRAEGKLKRQRLERKLQDQYEQRRHREPGADAPGPFDVDAALRAALELVQPISGLKAEDAESSSFDENDYYSSQVQSDWSSTASSRSGSDKAAGAFTGDLERLNGGSASKATPASRPLPGRGVAATELVHARPQPYHYGDEDDDMYEPEDDDDDYAPPDPSAHDIVPGRSIAAPQVIPTDEDEDNSDYEPGELIAESMMPPPQPVQPSPHVPVIRNHLTHIAAPQPNRVSPLATAKRASYELELINGQPQVVMRPRQVAQNGPSRASTASPSGNNATGSARKKKAKKRKRDQEASDRAKKRQQRQKKSTRVSPASPIGREPSIKNEPLSSPPFTPPAYPAYNEAVMQQAPRTGRTEEPVYVHQTQPEPPRSGLRYEYAQPVLTSSTPSTIRLASPSYHRPGQRDTQDLRRVASIHYAQRPPSPVRRGSSPAGPYHGRVTSMTYGDPRLTQHGSRTVRPEHPAYAEQTAAAPVEYARAARSRSPVPLQEYREPYSAPGPAPVTIPPPAPAPLRRVLYDSYGNQYVETDSAPVYAPKASIAPVEHRPPLAAPYERALSRAPTVYAPPPPPSVVRYEPVDSRIPPPAARQPEPEQYVDYVDANGVSIRDAYSRATQEPIRYGPKPTSPVYQPVRGYEQMMPPPPPQRLAPEPTSPAYAPVRSYSVRPEEPPRAQPAYIRQGSVAPVQYARQEPLPPAARAASVMPAADYSNVASVQYARQDPAPPAARAASVMPGLEYNNVAPPSQRPYSQAPPPQNIRYVDRYGNEVFPRQVSELRYP